MKYSRNKSHLVFKIFMWVFIIFLITGGTFLISGKTNILDNIFDKNRDIKITKDFDDDISVIGEVTTKKVNFEQNNEKQEDENISKDQEESIPNIVTKVLKSVVGVTTDSAKFKDRIFNMNGDKVISSGSGVIISEQGYILTNNHIFGNNPDIDKISVSLYDGRQSKGEIIWSNSKLDLAILKIEEKGLNIGKLGDSNGMTVGENVFAIGNPFGLNFKSTVTSGIISALNRTVKLSVLNEATYMKNLIQTDASINPGNSGGPLINEQGEIIGINTIKVSSAEGIGFAIPINIIKPIINKLYNKGKFDEPYLGVDVFDMDYIPVFNDKLSEKVGVYVNMVDKKSPAFKMGITSDCLITEINGNRVTTASEFRQILYKLEPEDEVVLKCFKDNKFENIKLVLSNIKSNEKDK